MNEAKTVMKEVNIDELVIALVRKNDELVDVVNELMDKVKELEMRVTDLENVEEEVLVDEEYVDYVEKTEAIDAISAFL